MKFDILNRWDGSIIATADIDTDSEDKAIQLGLAAQWAISNKVNLMDADLRGSNLRGANLSWANLIGANLSGSNLRGANLSGSDLRGSNLRGVNLSGSNLSWANLSESDLSGSDLSGSTLRGTTGNIKHIKTMQIDGWPISYTATDMQIGCQRHPIDKWRKFQDKTIDRMDINALAWWKIWKPIIFQIIGTSPAEPTKDK